MQALNAQLFVQGHIILSQMHVIFSFENVLVSSTPSTRPSASVVPAAPPSHSHSVQTHRLISTGVGILQQQQQQQ